MDVIKHPAFAGLTIPLLFLLIGPAAKRLMRKGASEEADFFFGFELILAAISTELLYGYDAVIQLINKQNDGSALVGVFFFLVVTIPTTFAILVLHQHWDDKKDKKTYKWLALGGVGNLLGGLFYFSFIYWSRS